MAAATPGFGARWRSADKARAVRMGLEGVRDADHGFGCAQHHEAIGLGHLGKALDTPVLVS